LKNYVHCAAVALFGVSTAFAGSLEFDLDNMYAGTVAPSATLPWVKATFTDIDATHVSLKLDAVGLVSSEFVSEWAFNIDPQIDPSTVSFTQTSHLNYAGYSSTSVTAVANGSGAGPAHGFDIDFGLGTSQSSRFGVAAEVIYTLTRAAGLSAANFNFSNASGSTITTTAAHVQSIGAEGEFSAWVDPSGPGIVSTTPVPEASTVAVPIFAAVAAGFAIYHRRRERQN
jgi:hypothetical protein